MKTSKVLLLLPLSQSDILCRNEKIASSKICYSKEAVVPCNSEMCEPNFPKMAFAKIFDFSPLSRAFHHRCFSHFFAPWWQSENLWRGDQRSFGTIVIFLITSINSPELLGKNLLVFGYKKTKALKSHYFLPNPSLVLLKTKVRFTLDQSWKSVTNGWFVGRISVGTPYNFISCLDDLSFSGIASRNSNLTCTSLKMKWPFPSINRIKIIHANYAYQTLESVMGQRPESSIS